MVSQIERVLRDIIRRWGSGGGVTPVPVAGPAPQSKPRTRGEFPAFHGYLDQRYADLVILTFGQIEDLLGSRLPDRARVDAGWWAGGESDTARYAVAWLQAGRTARPNLPAGNVAFERVAESRSA
ncbi:MAG: hypothetical protein ABL971_00950 [Vicinamibacterales bacterium]